MKITANEVDIVGTIRNVGRDITTDITSTAGVTLSSVFQTTPLSTLTSQETSLFQVLFPAIAGVTTISCPNLVTSGINISGNSLTTISIPVLATTPSIVISGWALSGLSFPLLTAITYGLDCSNVGFTTLSMPSLATIGATLTLAQIASLTSFDMSGLVSVGNTFLVSNVGAPISTIVFPALTTVITGDVTFNVVNTTTVSLPVLTTVSGALNVVDSPSLTTLTLSHSFNGLNLLLTGNAFSQACVDDILDALDDAGYSGGTVDLSGGTNATPSNPAGLASKANLVGKGWTVTNN